ncbi:hypothetical protein D3C85_1077810 [compost metagenome]
MGDGAVLQITQPLRRCRVTRVAEPVEAMAGEHHIPVGLAKRALGARCNDAACVRNQCSNRLLATQAVLQQDQFGIGGQAWGQPGNRLFGVIGLAGHQQAMNGGRCVGRLGRDGEGLAVVVFHQRQAACILVGAQALLIAQDQMHRQATARQAASPEAAQASGAENMPGTAHRACFAVGMTVSQCRME